MRCTMGKRGIGAYFNKHTEPNLGARKRKNGSMWHSPAEHITYGSGRALVRSPQSWKLCRRWIMVNAWSLSIDRPIKALLAATWRDAFSK